MTRNLLVFVVLVLPRLAAAHDVLWTAREDSAAYRAECSACHIAFPPALLAVDDWLAIMSDLEHHFGANASLEPGVRKKIAAFLERNGANNPAFASREETPRITTASWFLRKHRGALRMLVKGKVKSLADCAACHKGPEIDLMTGE
jgi:hypothetical protein